MVWLLRAELLLAATLLSRHADKLPFLTIVLVGTIPIYLRVVRDRSWGVWAGGFAALCLLNARSWQVLPALAGAACLVDARRLKDSLRLLAMPLFTVAICPTGNLFIHLFPNTLDPQLAYLDHLIWGNSTRVIWDYTLAHPLFNSTVWIAYIILPFFVAGVVAITKTFRSLLPFAAATALGVGCYFLCPASGPAYYWQGIVDAPRNAMPSLHVTWALLMVMTTLRHRAARVVMMAFAAVTCVATIATGEHYVVDVLAAFPFAALVWLISTRLEAWFQRRFIPAPAPAVAKEAA